MAWTKGHLTYFYEVRIDLSSLVDKIAEKIGHMDDGYCWDVDDDKLVISARHTTGFRHWHCKATLESPAEDEFTLDHCVADEVDAESAVLDSMHELTGINAEIIVHEPEYEEE